MFVNVVLFCGLLLTRGHCGCLEFFVINVGAIEDGVGWLSVLLFAIGLLGTEDRVQMAN